MLWALTTVRRRIHSPEMPGTRTSPALKCVHEGARTAKPKSILKLMNVDGLTKANIKSHLQKYRCLMQKKARNGQPAPLQPGIGTTGGLLKPAGAGGSRLDVINGNGTCGLGGLPTVLFSRRVLLVPQLGLAVLESTHLS